MSNDSLQFLEREKKRLFQEIDRLKAIMEIIEKQRTKPPHLCNFAIVLNKCHSAFASTLQKRLERIASKGIPAELASLMISDLDSHIKEFCDVMYSITINAVTGAPRDLYHLLDQFLNYHNTPTGIYIVFMHDQIAVQTFFNLLLTKGFQKTYPEFWEAVKGIEFYFVSVMESMAKVTSSLNWPIVLHEMAHIVCYHQGINKVFLREIPMFGEIEVDRGEKLEGTPKQIEIIKEQNEKARKKRHITEFLADIMVTRCFGVIYGWRFFEMYGTLSSIFEPTIDHPSEYRRIELMANELEKQLGRRQDATFLRRKLPRQTRTNPASISNRGEIVAVPQSVLQKMRSYGKYVLTNDQEDRSLRESPWSRSLIICGKKPGKKTLIDLQEDLFEGKSVVVEPPVLYDIAMQNLKMVQVLLDPLTPEDKEKSDKIWELLAECIRLFSVQQEFATKVEPLLPGS